MDKYNLDLIHEIFIKLNNFFSMEKSYLDACKARRTAKLIFSHAYKSVSLLHKHISLNVAFQN